MADPEYPEDEVPPKTPIVEAELEDDVDPLPEDEGDEESSDPVGETEEETEEPEVVAQQERRQSPASRRVQQAVNEAKAAREEAARVRQEMQELLRQAQAPRHDPMEEQRQLEMMTPDERANYHIQKVRYEAQTEIRNLALRMEISADKAEFNSFLSANPEYKKFEAEVEKIFQAQLGRGQPQTRQTIFDYTLGKAMREKRAALLPRARKAGEDNIRRQQTRPSSPRSNVSGGSSRSDADAAYERLVKYAERGGTL